MTYLGLKTQNLTPAITGWYSQVVWYRQKERKTRFQNLNCRYFWRRVREGGQIPDQAVRTRAHETNFIQFQTKTKNRSEQKFWLRWRQVLCLQIIPCSSLVSTLLLAILSLAAAVVNSHRKSTLEQLTKLTESRSVLFQFALLLIFLHHRILFFKILRI